MGDDGAASPASLQSACEGDTTRTMFDYTNPDDVASIENPTSEQEIGLLAGLADGHFICVQHRGFMVARNDHGDVEVSLEGEVLGGRYHLTKQNFAGFLAWIENKVELYGGVAA